LNFYLRSIILAILLFTLFFRCSAILAEGVSSTTLPDGMKVIIRESHAINLAAVDIWVKAGSVNETSANSGISHFVEHMTFKATDKYGPGQIDREIEGLGAELNGGASRDWVHFYTTVASEYLPTALEVLADAIMNARFRPEDVEKERQVILDEIARAESNPSQRALHLFSQAAFTVHPYRLPPTGARESISKLSRDDLAAYYNRYYRPENTCVVIVGDVVTSDVLALAQRAFSGFGRAVQGGQPTSPPAEPPLTSARVRRFRSLTDKAYVVLGYHAAPASELREVCALDTILALLGDTYRGRISAALNANGIQFSAAATDFIAQRYPATFSVLVSVSPADVERVVSILLSEFHRLGRHAAPDSELEQAKRLVEGSDLFEQETVSGQARALGLYESVASYDLLLKYAPTVRSISPADIMEVAKKYFAGSNCCVALIEPEQPQK